MPHDPVLEAVTMLDRQLRIIHAEMLRRLPPAEVTIPEPPKDYFESYKICVDLS